MNTALVNEVTPALVQAFDRLIPQLTTSQPPPTLEQLSQMVSSQATTLFACYDEDDTIVGVLTLVIFRIPTGIRARIEDVVVDARARGRGIGQALMQAGLEHAWGQGATAVDLTSRPSREAANRLYQRMGFQRRDTNVYRYTL